MTKDHVLFQTDKIVDFARKRRFGKNFSRLLETGRRNEAGTLNRRLGNTKQLSTVSRLLGLGTFGWLATKGFDLGVGLFEDNFGNDLGLAEIAVAFVGDFDALGKLIVNRLKVETIANQTRQHVRVASRFNFHFTKHSRDNDLNVLVVDFHTLASINLLNLVAKILLNGFFT